MKNTDKTRTEIKKLTKEIALKALNEININEYADVIGGILDIKNINKIYKTLEELKSFIKRNFK